MDDIRHLTSDSKYDFFKSTMMGEVFTFSSDFNFQLVLKLAKLYGQYVMYCEEGTEFNTLYGTSTCRVVGTTTVIQQPFPDNTEVDLELYADQTDLPIYTLQEIIDLIEFDRNNLILDRSISNSLLELKSNVNTAISLAANSSTFDENLFNSIVRICALGVRIMEKMSLDNSR